MQILRKNEDLNLVLNHETDFQTNLGWQENLAQLEDEILSDIINPTENYETVRFIHEPYNSTNHLSENVVEQTDIWFYFYFLNNGTYNNGLDYNRVGITTRENAKMLRQSTESFFRLEFYKTPHILDFNGDIVGYEPPTRINRKLVFAKNLSLPLGEKVFYTGENFNEYIHVPVFMGSNYKNKENMYFFWFQDESVLTETTLSGTTTGNTFFMTAKFFNASDGSIIDFTNDVFSTSYSATGLTESTDMYYQIDINKLDYSYRVYLFDGTKSTDRYGRTCLPIQFYERGGGSFTKPTYDCTSYVPPPTPDPTQSPTPTITIAPTPTPTPTPAGNGGGGGGESPVYKHFKLRPCANQGQSGYLDGVYDVWSISVLSTAFSIGDRVEGATGYFYVVVDYQLASLGEPSSTLYTVTLVYDQYGEKVYGCEELTAPTEPNYSSFVIARAATPAHFSLTKTREALCGNSPTAAYSAVDGVSTGGTIATVSVVRISGVTPPISNTTYTVYSDTSLNPSNVYDGGGKYYGVIVGGGSNITHIVTINSVGLLQDWVTC